MQGDLRVNSKGWPRSKELSNFLPSACTPRNSEYISIPCFFPLQGWRVTYKSTSIMHGQKVSGLRFILAYCRSVFDTYLKFVRKTGVSGCGSSQKDGAG